MALKQNPDIAWSLIFPALAHTQTELLAGRGAGQAPGISILMAPRALKAVTWHHSDWLHVRPLVQCMRPTDSARESSPQGTNTGGIVCSGTSCCGCPLHDSKLSGCNTDLPQHLCWECQKAACLQAAWRLSRSMMACWTAWRSALRSMRARAAWVKAAGAPTPASACPPS